MPPFAQIYTCPNCEIAKTRSAFPKNRPMAANPWCSRCEARHRKIMKATRIENNGDKRARVALLNRMKKHGITQQRFESMLTSQDGRCAICGEHMRLPCIDHDHRSGQVRGLLCTGCNTGIGDLKDDPRVVKAALDYLIGWATVTRASTSDNVDNPFPTNYNYGILSTRVPGGEK